MRAQLQDVVFWLMVAGVLAASLALGANRPVSWLALSGGAIVLFAVQMLIDLTDRAAGRLWIRLLPIAILYLGAVAWAAFQAQPLTIEGWAHPAWGETAAGAGIDIPGAISADPDATWHGVLRYLGYASVFWIAARGGSNLERAKMLVDVIAFFSAGLALYGLVVWALGFNPIVGEPGYPGVVTASFVNRNAYAFYAGIGAMACLSALAFRLPKSKGDDWGAQRAVLRDFFDMLLGEGRWFVIGFIVLLAAIFLTGSRAGAAVSVIGVAIVMFLTFGKIGGVLRWLSIGMLALPIAVLALGANVLNERLDDKDPFKDQRMTVYERVWQGIWEQPLQGHGLGSFHDTFRQYIPPHFSGSEWDLAHNSYLENAFELGVPAAAALTVALALIVWGAWVGLSERRRMRPLMSFGLAVFVAGALHAVVDFSLQMPACAAMFALIAGPVWALARREAGDPRPRRRKTRSLSTKAPLSVAPEDQEAADPRPLA